jgi:hypothetical protein
LVLICKLAAGRETKVFWFFFSKKNAFPTMDQTLPGDIGAAERGAFWYRPVP